MTARKYAPALDDGRKPWVVTSTHWGRESHYIVYAHAANDAKRYRRMMHLEYRTVRRATPHDVAIYHVEGPA